MESNAAQTPARPQSRFNRFFARWLASPFGFLSGNAVLVRYTGRISGLRRQLPVNLFRYEDGYLIRVGKPQDKRWWRNFRSPWPVQLIRGPRRIRGSAVVVPGTTGRGQSIAAAYFATRRGAARRAGLPRLHRGEQPTPEALQAAAAGLVFVVVTPER
jgi:hypothetical protein